MTCMSTDSTADRSEDGHINFESVEGNRGCSPSKSKPKPEKGSNPGSRDPTK